MSKEMHKFVKPVKTKPGTMYVLFKANKEEVDGCHPFRLILLALQTPKYKFTEFLDRISNPLTKTTTLLKTHFIYRLTFYQHCS